MKYPIGQQDFANIREEGKVYVDKTDLIYNLTQKYNYVFLSRPRRFGKSLLLSTIQAYFEGRKELFEGLALSSLEKDWKKHPVLKISLGNINVRKENDLEDELGRQFSIWESHLGLNNSQLNLSSRFASIITHSYKQTGERVVVLIDEYDNPLINTLSDLVAHERNRNLLKSIYSNLKDQDQYIRFGMLTGVSRFSKMTIFSGLNNLYDISFDDDFETICGITPTELDSCLRPGIEKLAHKNEISYEEAIELLKKNYDGYHFSGKLTDIYNPFSLLTALSKSEIGSYWFATGTPSFLVERLYNDNVNLTEFLNSEATVSTLSSSDASHKSTKALLYQTGYLTIKEYDREWQTYGLGIPNLEVKRGLLQDMAYIFQDKQESEFLGTLRKMVRALENGEPEEFLISLQAYLAGIPANLTQKSSELFFENNIYIILNLLGVYCNAETVIAKGRIDLVVKTRKYIYIFELKLDKTAEEALNQIEEKGYALPYWNEGKQVFKIGVSFSSDTRNIDKWIIKKLDL